MGIITRFRNWKTQRKFNKLLKKIRDAKTLYMIYGDRGMGKTIPSPRVYYTGGPTKQDKDESLERIPFTYHGDEKE